MIGILKRVDISDHHAPWINLSYLGIRIIHDAAFKIDRFAASRLEA